MSKIQSPLLGYNNNVRHKNRVFHIQTEDSGVKHPHVITHLFMDGGRILKSVKRSYGEHLGSEGLADTVRQMMKEQHKAMFIALRDGEYDALLEPAAAPTAAAEARGPETSRDRPVSEPPPSARVEPPKQALSTGGIPAAVPAQALAARRANEPRNVPAAAPAQAQAAPKKSPGRERSAARRDEPARSRRYAPARPAAIFGQSPTATGSIFGEELVGDKTLDEVILGYLVEDLTQTK
ncbi:MAG TPA: hypothetical protein PLR99_13770 [Polyangiaceae bacterium]|nr:hypothetical protein [Polyangiaceae bacterium]